MTIVIFGGTAAYHLTLSDFAQVEERRVIETPYGPSAVFVRLSTDKTAVWFSSRHGETGLQRSAGFVNHRANVWAARELGAKAILSWNGVGAIAPGLAVGNRLIPDDVLDMTRARIASFGPEARALPSGRPFDDVWRDRLVAACQALELPVATHGTYVCTEGPRLETAAEISLYGWGGAAVVGMTVAPEIWLAGELEVPYASVCIVTNMATGRWHLDPKRDFSPGVGAQGLRITLEAARQADAVTA